VFGLILKEGAALALAGSGLGLLGACLVGHTMRGMLFGVGTIDLSAFGAVAFVLLAAACWRATSRRAAPPGSIRWWRCGTNEGEQ